VSVSPEGLVGRDGEVALAVAELRRLRAGRAAAFVIEGEAGIGKTRLVQGIVEEAQARDMVAFVGQAHPFERTRPFSAMAAALDLNRRSKDPRRAAIGALLGGGGAESQYRILEEIVDLVESGCAQGPVVLVVDDIHWADQATLSAILSVVRQLTLQPLLVVVTARPSPRSADVARLLEDLATGGARTLGLLPLTPDDVAVLARQVLGAAPGPELSAVLAKAGGNPLWVRPCCAPWPTRACCVAPVMASRRRRRSCPTRSVIWWYAGCSTYLRRLWSCCRSPRFSEMRCRCPMSLLSPTDPLSR
jgi:predicted ATPase